MAFNSFAFLGLMLAVGTVRLIFWRRSNAPAFLWSLLAASLVFYGWHRPGYLLVLLATVTVDYWAAATIDRLLTAGNRRRAKVWLVASLTVNLAMLGLFKYAAFLADSTRAVLQHYGWTASAIPAITLALPIGISFYTFHSMSYTIDVYRRVLRPSANYPRFLLFVTFFPELVAGPIVRAREFLYQFDRRRALRWRVWLEGSYLVIRGFMLKMVVADNIGVFLASTPDTTGAWTLASTTGASSTLAWTCAFLFSMQIFADFCGYTDIARGVAYWLGYRLPINFDSPYIARSFSDFWRRWHISLSTWLRDYLYIPLGGNRRGHVRTYVNLLIVMFLGGLWHGAAWTFVAWGVMHGVALGIERMLGMEDPSRKPWPAPLVRAAGFAWFLVVQLGVLVAWIYFRSDTFTAANTLIANRFAFDFRPAGVANPPQLQFALFVTLAVIAMHARQAAREIGRLPLPGGIERAVLAAGMLYLVLSLYGQSNEFIYFQF